jgi:hypothetical protein
MMLLTPFLGKWGWVRQLEQVGRLGAQQQPDGQAAA